ncbi:MFS transporter [Kitasatospora sp. NPDC097605]|uniref:MFS transporter n=1 Tax=Kitasatospora sp. NPDC097605 TaxID=3157226 RepID=UPI00332B503D
MALTGSIQDARSEIAERMNRLPLTRTHRRVVLVVGVALFFDMFEIFMSGVLGTVMREEYHLNRTEVSAVIASVFVGMSIGVLAMGRLADRLGRRRALLVSVAVYSVFSALGGLSHGMPMLVAARLLAGLGIGPVLPLADAYLSDLLPARLRGRWTALAYTIAFLGVPAVGLTARWLVPLSPLGVDGWRWLFLTGAVGGFAVLAARRLFIESPRWLESAGRTAEADAILTRLEREAGAAAPASAARIPEQAAAPEPVAEPVKRAAVPAAPEHGGGAHGGDAQGDPESESARARPALGAVHRRRVTMMTIFHLLQAFGGYGFGTMAPLVLAAKGYSVVNSLLFSALSFAGYPLGSLFSVPLIERVERKYLIVGSSLAMASFGLLFGYASVNTTIVLAGVAYTAVSNVFSNAYHVYQVEIFPTTHRVAAVSWTYSLSRITTAAMPFVLVPLLSRYGPNALFGVVAATLVAIAVDIGVLGPRSNGSTLEDLNERLAPVRRPG